MSLGDYTRRVRGGSFPRVSGDEPGFGSGVRVGMVFSPREWG